MDQQKNETSSTGWPQPSFAESNCLASVFLEARSGARQHASLSNREYNDKEKPINQKPIEPRHSVPPEKAKVNNPIQPKLPGVHRPALCEGIHSTRDLCVPMMNSFSPEQLEALRASVAKRIASFTTAAGAGAVSGSTGSLDFFRQASMAGLHIPVYSAQGLSVQAVAPLPAPLLGSGLPPLTEQTNTSVVSCAERIRREHVEAALTSKPQRGRKREDLSELERIEVTRTRNREHAKSTRCRKKARFEELLDLEKKFKEIKDQSALQERRRETICRFLRIREQMLQSFRSSESLYSSGKHTTPEIMTIMKESWEDLVENAALFQFDEGWQKNENQVTSRPDQKNDHQVTSNSERMKRFDEYVHSSVVAKFGNIFVPMLRYGIKGGQDGIALDDSNGGLMEVEVFLAWHTKITLLTGMVRFRFAAGEEQLQVVSHVHAMGLLASSEH